MLGTANGADPRFVYPESDSGDGWKSPYCKVDPSNEDSGKKQSPPNEPVVVPATGADAGKPTKEYTFAAKDDEDRKWSIVSLFDGEGETLKRYTARVGLKGELDSALLKSHQLTIGKETYYYLWTYLHVGGEHLIAANAKGDAELQILFQAEGAADKKVSVAVPFKKKAGSAEFDFLNDMTNTIETKVHESNVAVEIDQKADEYAKLDIKDLMEKNILKKDLVFYEGSLTSPNCAASDWLVLKTPIEISEAQFTILKSFIGVKDSYAGNVRDPKMWEQAPKFLNATISAPSSGSNAGYSQSPKTAAIVAGSLLAMTAVAAF